jgi:hypothetical protein
MTSLRLLVLRRYVLLQQEMRRVVRGGMNVLLLLLTTCLMVQETSLVRMMMMSPTTTNERKTLTNERKALFLTNERRKPSKKEMTMMAEVDLKIKMLEDYIPQYSGSQVFCTPGQITLPSTAPCCELSFLAKYLKSRKYPAYYCKYL